MALVPMALPRATSHAAVKSAPRRSARVESVVALIVAALAFAVLICAAAIAPPLWTFASIAVAESYMPARPTHVPAKDNPDRLAPMMNSCAYCEGVTQRRSWRDSG